MKTVNNIQKNLLKRYVVMQCLIACFFSLVIAVGIVYNFFDREKKQLEIFAFEESEEYVHVLNGNVKVADIKQEYSKSAARYCYYVYNLKNELVGSKAFEEPVGSLFKNVVKKLNKNEIGFRFFYREDKIMPFLVAYTQRFIYGTDNKLGYIYVGCEISHQFKRVLRSIVALMFLTLVSFFMFYRLSLAMVAQAMKPIVETLENQRCFIADSSHELKTPLSIFLTSLECLRRDKENVLSDFSKETIQNLDSEVKRMRNLVEALMRLARGYSSSEAVDKEVLEFNKIINEQFYRFQILAKEKNINISFCSEVGSAIFYANKIDIENLVTQLVDNALKYTNKGGSVKVSLKKTKDRFLLSVHDSGVGIPEEELEKIFQRFYRIDKSRATMGIGLGLAIAKNCAEKNDIDINVESFPGKGSVFTLIIKEFVSR